MKLFVYTMGSCALTMMVARQSYDVAVAHLPSTSTSSQTAYFAMSVLFRSKLNLLVILNMAYNILFLVARLTQYLFFGKLRVYERKLMYDRLLNYLLFKVVFVGAVVSPDLNELLVWTSWFSILGFLKLFAFLGRDRFEYLMFSPNVTLRAHARVISLLALILLGNAAWFGLCLYVFGRAGLSTMLLLSYECMQLLVDTVQTLVKYTIHLWDVTHESHWENRGVYIYYTEFFSDSLNLVLTLLHCMHIWSLHGVSFTLIDAILFLHMRGELVKLRRKVSDYRNYRRALRNMESRFPNASAEDLASFNDDCAICRDSMTQAKKLPCNHIFHLECLRSWLEHHSSCPTCRASLIQDPATGMAAVAPRGENGTGTDAAQTMLPGAVPGAPAVGPGAVPRGLADGPALQQSSVFRFSSSIFSWLPSFSLEVVRRTGPQGVPGVIPVPVPAGAGGNGPAGNAPVRPAPTENDGPQLPAFVVQESMIEYVRSIFPQFNRDLIAADLMHSRSAEVTINNILEGRLVAPSPAESAGAEATGAQEPQPTETTNTTTRTNTEDDRVRLENSSQPVTMTSPSTLQQPTPTTSPSPAPAPSRPSADDESARTRSAARASVEEPSTHDIDEVPVDENEEDRRRRHADALERRLRRNAPDMD